MKSTLKTWSPLQTSTWDPFQEIRTLGNRLENFFGRNVANGNGGQKETITLADWSPAVDITEDDKEFLVQAELPELKKEEVKITVENGTLTISGERKSEKEEKNKKYHRVERSYGCFERSFTLPDGVSADKVNADFKDGMLKVHLPKDEKAKPKAIEVKVN